MACAMAMKHMKHMMAAIVVTLTVVLGLYFSDFSHTYAKCRCVYSTL